MSSDVKTDHRKALQRLGIAVGIIVAIVATYAKTVSNDRTIRHLNQEAKLLIESDNHAELLKAAKLLDESLDVRGKERFALGARAAVAAELALEYGVQAEGAIATELSEKGLKAKLDSRGRDMAQMAAGLAPVIAGKPAEAEPMIAKLVEAEGGNATPEQLFARGMARVRSGHTADGLKDLRQAFEGDAGNRHFSSAFGEAAFDAGDLFMAGIAFQRGLELPQARKVPRGSGKGDAGDQDGDGIRNADDKCPAEAEDKDGFEDKDGCLDADNDKDSVPDDADACPLLAGTVAAKGCNIHQRSVIGRARVAIELSENIEKQLETLNSLLAATGDAALPAPLKARALLGKAEALVALKKYPEAREAAQQAAAAGGAGDTAAAHAEFITGVAIAYEKTGGAADKLNKAADLQPSIARFYFRGAKVLAEAGAADAGQKLLERFEKANPGAGADFKAAKGSFLIASGKQADGIKLLKEALDENGNNITAMRDAARALVGSEADIAEGFYQRLVAVYRSGSREMGIGMPLESVRKFVKNVEEAFAGKADKVTMWANIGKAIDDQLNPKPAAKPGETKPGAPGADPTASPATAPAATATPAAAPAAGAAAAAAKPAAPAVPAKPSGPATAAKPAGK